MARLKHKSRHRRQAGKSLLRSLERIQSELHEIDQKVDHLIRSLRLHFASHTHPVPHFTESAD